MHTEYNFTTHWHVDAPLQEVWELIYHSEEWPQWWADVISVVESSHGDDRGIGSIRHYILRSPTGYKLSFNLLLTGRLEYQLLEGNASGELEGKGSWHFKTATNGGTHVECLWNVNTKIDWMNKLSFLLRPVFKYNHKIVMRRGAKGMARKLNARLISFS